MIRTQDIMKSLPLVASVLGDKYGVTVNIGGKNAYTDGKNINLPTLPLDCKDELLMLARAYIDHESAHIRETDFEAVRQANLTPIQHHIWNILEDFRVEQKLAALFTGCRRHFRWLIEHLFAKDTEDEAGDTTPAFSVLNWLLLTVRAWEVPAVGHWRDKEAVAVEQAFPGLLANMQPVLERVRQQCRSTQEAIDYAIELTEVLHQFTQQKDQGKSPNSDATSPAKNASTEESEENGSGDSESPSEQTGSAIQTLLNATAQDFPQLGGEWLAEQLNLKQAAQHTEGILVARTGNKPCDSLPQSVQRETLQMTTALRSRLHGLLQSQTRQRCVPGRRGSIDPQRIHALAVHNPRIFRKWGERQGISTAVHLLLDTSGSMSGTRMELASRACYAVAVALERCKVNAGVTAFPGWTSDEQPVVSPLLRHGERIHDRFSPTASGRTPLAESLWWVMQTMCRLKEQRKIILILSDGMPDSFTATRYALQQAQALDFEVMGLGIQDTSLTHLMSSASRTLFSRTINDLTELAPAMFGMLQAVLLGHGGMR